jgi:hypothetical protein
MSETTRLDLAQLVRDRDERRAADHGSVDRARAEIRAKLERLRHAGPTAGSRPTAPPAPIDHHVDLASDPLFGRTPMTRRQQLRVDDSSDLFQWSDLAPYPTQ